MKLLRISNDAQGETHFDIDEIKLTVKDFAPPASPFQVSEPLDAAKFILIELPVGWVGEAHVSPRKQILFCLSGEIMITSSRGEERIISAGMGLLMDDLVGRGHRSEVISNGAATAVIIQIK